jgi:PKD repeat protein
MNHTGQSSFAILFRLLIPVLCLTGIFSLLPSEVVAASKFAEESDLSSPLEIVDVGVNQDPLVGVPFELHVTVASIVDLENVKLVVDTPGAIQLISGKRITKLDLPNGSSFEETFTLVVKDEGEWLITISVFQKNAEFGPLSDIETVQVVSHDGGGTFLREEEIIYVQSDSRQPQAEAVSSIQSRSALATIPIPGTDEIQLKGTLKYESVYYDGDANNNGDLSDDDISNGAQPLPRAIVELWDRHPEGDRLLDTSRTDTNGNYEFYPTQNRNGIDLYLRIYASDYERVRVVDNMGWIIGVNAEYSGSTSDGIHTFNFTIPVSPAGSIPTEQAFYTFDLLARIGYGFMESQTGWGDSRLLTVHWPKNCILGTGGACYRGDIYLLTSDAKSPDVILHEYGHFVLSKYVGSLDVITACIQQGFKHYFWRESNATCAWSEGWADFFQMAVQNDPDYRGADHENVDSQLNQVRRLGGNPEAYENIVAASLWDIFDNTSSSEVFDAFFDGWDGPSQNGIWTFSSTPSYILFYRHPFTISEFWTAWKASRPDNTCFGSAIFQHHLLEFDPFMYGLETNSDGSRGNVVVSPAPGCPNQTYLEGTTVELQATSKPGYVFDTWEITPGGPNPVPPVDLEDPALTLTMSQAWTIRAQFIVEPTPTPTPTPSPTPAPSSITLTITSGNNDAGPNPDSGCSNQTYWNEIYFGECFNGQDITSGFRFTNLPIPPGSTINQAFLRFTTNGPYSNTLNLRIFGEASSDPAPFSPLNMSTNRPRTSSYRDWSIPAIDTWGLGNERSTPDLSAILQEMINNSLWEEGNSVVLLVTDNGNEGGRHRRVIGYERPAGSYTGHLAQLVISYTPGGVSPTPTPSPTATQDPGGGGGGGGGGCSCALLCRFGVGTASLRNDYLQFAHRIKGLMKQATIPWEMIETLQSLRDDIMSNTPEGQHYIELYQVHSPELAALLFEHDDLWDSGLETIYLFLPAFDAMLDGNGDEFIISEQQITTVEDILQLLSSYAGPELKNVIESELQILDFAEFENGSYAEAQSELLGNAPPIVDAGGPYSVDEGSEITLEAVAIDPDDDTFEFSWDLNDDGIYEKAGRIVQFSSAAIDGPSLVGISVRACDPRGGCDIDMVNVNVLNVAPIVDLGYDFQTYEGDNLLLKVQVNDPGESDTFTIVWDFGDGSASSQAFQQYHVYGDDGIYEVAVYVEDDDGGSGSDQLIVSTQNRTPEVEIETNGMVLFGGGRIFLVTLGQPRDFTTSAIDAGSDDLVLVWGFGATKTYFNNGLTPDESQSPAGVYPFLVIDKTQGIFSNVGISELQVTVVDDDGGSSQDQVPVMILGNAVCAQSQGFWKHQLSDKGKKQIDETTINAYLDMVGFSSSYFSEYADTSTVEAASIIMNPKGSEMRDKAQAQLLAAWLNFANGSVSWTEMIDVDQDGSTDLPLYEVLRQTESILLTNDASHEDLVLAKDLAESINLSSTSGSACSE